MEYPATIDPPSELVWSPRRGLRSVVLSPFPPCPNTTGWSSSENNPATAIPMEYNDIDNGDRDRDGDRDGLAIRVHDDVSECALSEEERGRLEDNSIVADYMIELEDPASSNENENSKKATDSSTNVHLVRNTASAGCENDLKTLVGDRDRGGDADGVAGKILVSEFGREDKKNCPMEEEMNPEKVVVDEDEDEYSPSNSWVRSYRRKGKKKASTEDTGEIVGSCNATEFSSGRRRLNFDQQNFTKNQVEETVKPASYLKPDSSFVYWMSNMMKGFLNSEADTPPVTFTITNSGRRFSPVVTSGEKKRDKSMGFLSILQSMSYLKRTVQEDAMMMMNDNTPPVNRTEESMNNSKRLLLTNEDHNGSKSGNGASLKINEIDSMENKTSCESEPRARTSSFTFTGKRKLDNTENIHRETLPENTVSETCGDGSDYLRSYWVTRFAPKKLRSSLNYVTTGDPVIRTDNDLEKRATETPAAAAASVGGGDMSPILLSERFKNAEAMASIFARRLDSIKGIIPVEVIEDVDFSNTICIFCGRNGHRLQVCSEITDSELEQLLNDINLRNRMEEGLPCLCIKCFRFNHWAHTCPGGAVAASKGSSRTDRGGGGGGGSDGCGGVGVGGCYGGGSGGCGGDGVGGCYGGGGGSGGCGGVGGGYGGGASLTIDSNRSKTVNPTVIGENLNKKYVGSTSGVNMCKDSQVVPQYTDFSPQNLDVPRGIFDSVRMLRLSRTNILKWMKSNASISRLDGFFLRLRIGKSEEGPRGLGYHAARIIVEQLQNSPRNCVSVDVGGMKCSVESRYISNHDFQEDELMAWWYATSKSDNNFCLENELRSKLEDRKTLAL